MQILFKTKRKEPTYKRYQICHELYNTIQAMRTENLIVAQPSTDRVATEPEQADVFVVTIKPLSKRDRVSQGSPTLKKTSIHV